MPFMFGACGIYSMDTETDHPAPFGGGELKDRDIGHGFSAEAPPPEEGNWEVFRVKAVGRWMIRN